ncbi:hypothetical protein CDL12_30251 [Handroanthus impetiginosus]|uniref:Copper chaperone n=1 Tax=Handroanthus impetiginosus TaxID=429701 RepID=A0A2G9FW40_9LAMI|nr:hypothetical protein CDL12_30251 [Handroanthus impetiginosus]
MKQKIVLRVPMDGKRCLPKGLKCLIYVLKMILPYEVIWKKRSISSDKIRKKAMKIAVTCPGVASVAIQGAEKNEMVVIGEGVDACDLAKSLRRNVSFAQVLSVAPEGGKK